MRYAVYVCTGDGTYRGLEQTFEAASPREAAQQAFDDLELHPDEEFPELLAVPDHMVEIFTRDDRGLAITHNEDIVRSLARGPRSAIVAFDPAARRDQQR